MAVSAELPSSGASSSTSATAAASCARGAIFSSAAHTALTSRWPTALALSSVASSGRTGVHAVQLPLPPQRARETRTLIDVLMIPLT